MGSIFCCFRVHDGHGSHSSNHTCSVGCCCLKCFIQTFINMHKNVAPRQETISASSNIQDGASSNSEVVETYSSNERRLDSSEQSEDERSTLLLPQQTNVAPRQETISTSSNNQDDVPSNSEVVENYSSNESRLDRVDESRLDRVDESRLDCSEHSEDKRSNLLLQQHTTVTPGSKTISTSSNNQDDTSSSFEVVDNYSRNESRLDSSEPSEDEKSILLLHLQAEIRKKQDKGRGSRVEPVPVQQILDQMNSEFVQKDDTFTPCCSSSVKKVSHEVESGFVYTFPLPHDEYDEDVCPTCLEEYDEENPKIIAKCNHHFHLSCIYEWMERSTTCPVCREVMLFDE